MQKVAMIGFISKESIKNSLSIAKDEVCNEIVVKLAALLHDIADSKFTMETKDWTETARAF
jgi:uncharacterized protein